MPNSQRGALHGITAFVQTQTTELYYIEYELSIIGENKCFYIIVYLLNTDNRDWQHC